MRDPDRNETPEKRTGRSQACARSPLIEKGMDATYMSPQELTRSVNSEYERQSKAIREANIKTD